MLKSIDLQQKVFLIVLLCTFATESSALRGSSVVLQARATAKAAELAGTNVQSENNAAETDEDGEGLGPVAENSTKPVLTGIPQIDYVHDPNLPRELNGYNLSSYPFYNKVPTDITFKCDGLHDGFYASVPHKCQLYHHCLFGTRYDFLCANYTAFDQKTFICHFVSEVDCENSSKYFKRNEALYKAADSTTMAPPSTTTTTTTTTTQAPTTYKDYSRERDRDRDYRDRDRDDFRDRMRDRDYRDRDRDRDYRERVRDRPRDRDRDRDYRDRDYRDRVRERDRNRDSFSHRKRKPLKRRRPVYEYYYDDVYADEEYDDDLPPAIIKKSRKVIESVKPAKSSEEREYSSKRKSKLDDDRSSIGNSRKPASRSEEYDDEYYDDEEVEVPARGSQNKPPSGGGSPVQVKPASTISVFSRPRAPPKINRPVPLNEKSKYEYVKNT